ncbi:MAG: hypothetical protein NTX59_11060 [Elusimicrobia bacterium]|nr:hypothetical protein [Elusimicrobiota bacterium]
MIKLPWGYAGWMLRDMSGAFLTPLLMLAVAFLLPAVVSAGGPGGPLGLFPYVLNFCAFVAILSLTKSIVNRDLKRGYYRIFFSRPLDPRGYYILRWLLGGVSLHVFAVLFEGIYYWKYGFFPPVLHYAWQLSLQYLVAGGLVFFLSSIFPMDIFVALPLCLLSLYAHNTLFCPDWLRHISVLLPPLYLCSAVGPVTGGLDLIYAAVYGGCLVAGALLALRLRRFGEGGRGD